MQAVPVIGLSATPWSKGLGKHYDHLIVGATTASLIEAGHLSHFRIFAPSEPDLARVRTVRGDFDEDDLGEVMNTTQLVGDVVDTWLARAKDLPTLAFCVDRQHAAHVEQRFREAGVASEYLDGQTTRADREKMFARFRSGETKVIVNIDVLTAGFDADVGCLIDARPTKSEVRYVQMFGRGLRSAPGKDRLIVLDHAGNVQRLGLVTDIHHEALDDGKPRKAAEKKAERKAHDIRLCDKCKAVLPRGKRICEACGHERPAATLVVENEGHLVEIGKAAPARKKVAAPSRLERGQFYAELRGYAAERGYAAGWTAHKFREKFGDWPGDFERMFSPEPPSLKTRNWIKSRFVAYVEARKHG
jgi:superfamily II DNA or RNA helicase